MVKQIVLCHETHRLLSAVSTGKKGDTAYIGLDKRSIVGFLGVAHSHYEHVATFYVKGISLEQMRLPEMISPSTGIASSLPLCGY